MEANGKLAKEKLTGKLAEGKLMGVNGKLAKGKLTESQLDGSRQKAS